MTYEPQWGTDVFGMYQSIVEGRPVPRELLVKDMPRRQARDLDYIVDQIDWEAQRRPAFQGQPLPRTDPRRRHGRSEGYVDRWVVYGKIGGKQYFSAKELTVKPGVKMTLKDNGASGVIAMQGRGRIGNLPLECPGDDPLRRADRGRGLHQRQGRQGGRGDREPGQGVPAGAAALLRPDVNPNAPEVGDYKKR